MLVGASKSENRARTNVETLLIAAVLAIPLWLNVLATRAVARDTLAERKQRVAQLLLVWLIPLVGALVVLGVHRAAEPPSRKYRQEPDPGDDFALSGRSQKGVREVVNGDD